MSSPPRLPHRFGAFARANAGALAIEFALVLPIMLAILVGCLEFGRALDNQRKVESLARTIADLTSQGDTTDVIRSATMADIVASGKLVLGPFNGTAVKIVVSALAVDLAGTVTKPRVCSSYATANASARSLGLAGDVTIPTGFNTPGMRYVFAEISMPYTPLFGSEVVRFFTGANNVFSLSSSMPWPVRVGKSYNENPYNEVIMPGGRACYL